MLKRLLAMLLLVVFGVQGTACTVPDDENWNKLNDTIGGLPPAQFRLLQRSRARVNALRFFKKVLQPLPDDDVVVKYDCIDQNGNVSDDAVMTVHLLIQCLENGANWDPPSTFDSCINHTRSFVEGAKRLITGFHTTCRPVFEPKWIPVVNSHPEWDPDTITEEDITRAMIQEDGPGLAAYGAIGLAVVGGLLVATNPIGHKILVPLCGLNARGCPSNPFEAPGQTPQPDDGDTP